MSGNSLSQRKAQLDKQEREHLEDIVTKMRKRVENNVEFQLKQKGLDPKNENRDAVDEDTHNFVEAINLETVDGGSWSEAFDQYVTGVGYTIINRLSALRCMEVRGFIDEEVTVFKDNGLTPAAETLVHEEFLLEDEAIVEAYHNVCNDLAQEIKILFDPSSVYSLIDPDDDTFEELCGMLDSVPDKVWRADDVLGWVYEYYNHGKLDSLRNKAQSSGLDVGDVAAANQFYTPHWVVRMLTDNSLGKLYLEHTGELNSVISEQKNLSPEERKNRPLSMDISPTIADFCTYLTPEEREPVSPEFDHPREINVIDPACGSGHFLLYAFDVLERIWLSETNIAGDKIPSKILEHNIYGVDLDLRACQLAAFSLYLKGRTRASAEGADQFEMPEVGIVCANAKIADVSSAEAVFAEVAGDHPELKQTLHEILTSFETVHGLGSLLDVRGTLEEEFEREDQQLTWDDTFSQAHTLSDFLESLREAISQNKTTNGGKESFLARDLRSFIRLLEILSQKYHVSLMNPPYGSRQGRSGRMPKEVHEYVQSRYQYTPEYYISFAEVCQRLVRSEGRIGMLVPRSFMFKRRFEDFRLDFIEQKGSFDFLAEFGLGVLDNATIRTIGTVIRSTSQNADRIGDFYRLHDVSDKENVFYETLFGQRENDSIKRHYQRQMEEFLEIPGAPISYWVPPEIREIYEADTVLDPERGRVDADGVGVVLNGLQTGNNERFVHKFWENKLENGWTPFAKGGVDSWIVPRMTQSVYWGETGTEVRRSPGSGLFNESYYFNESLTFNLVKEGGRRFGYLNEQSIFASGTGPAFIPTVDINLWSLLPYLNSTLVTYLMLAQTPDRHWQVGSVSKLPWDPELSETPRLPELSTKIFHQLRSLRKYEYDSPYYNGPLLLHLYGAASSLLTHLDHPHRHVSDEQDVQSPELTAEVPIQDAIERGVRHLSELESSINELSNEIDKFVIEHLDVNSIHLDQINQEIALRTNQNPKDSVDLIDSSLNTESFVENLLHHLLCKIVSEAEDGIVPTEPIPNEPSALDQIQNKFEEIFGEYADMRLSEVDSILGDRPADNNPFPNVQAWIKEQAFKHHIGESDRTPIVWRLTTKRLATDSVAEGFACFVDFHSFESNLIDRLQNHYLEPRRAYLRERRSAANRQRNDDSLSTTKQSEAAEKYKRYESSLQQISLFEDKLANLAQPSPREWPEHNKQIATNATDKVAKFRDRTVSLLETLKNLTTLDDVDMKKLFSPTFYETVQENQDEWLDALNDLENAFEAYTADGCEPVEAHLYDLFGYYKNLVGSAHYASNGILFMTYYFNNIEDIGQSQIVDENNSQRQRLLSELSSDIKEYKDLANEIGEACDEIKGDIPSEWTERALSEITTAGYQPNQKYGVVINIKPLVEAKIVPETVEQQVI